jgi:lambda repressor-like predicted transcriptional regulator
MARCPTVINAIFAPLVVKPSQKALTACTIVAMSVLNKFAPVLQAHSEGSSLRGVSRTTGLAYNTVVSIVRSASQKAQLVHNAEVQAVQTEEVSADEMWSFVSKNRNSVAPKS